MPPLTRSQASHPAPSSSSISSSFLTNDPLYTPPLLSVSTTPPVFSIDLSLPPERRYLALCAAFKQEMQSLTSLFDELVAPTTRIIPPPVLRFLCRLFLFRVWDAEETRELRGISAETGVEMYLLVCFNVLLDLLMGCSSGGAVVREGEADGGGSGSGKMVHFRTLDWGMPALRRVVVQLDYKMGEDGEVVGSSVTYAGFVGVLTGVRKGLSLSLNFRHERNEKGRVAADVRYYWHLGMVLLGWRRSIASELRGILLPKKREGGRTEVWGYEEVVPRGMDSGRVGVCGRWMITTACYLCFCDGEETTVLEKDRVSSVVHRSREFVVVTNNDMDSGSAGARQGTIKRDADESAFAQALAEFVNDAADRKECAEQNYYNQRTVKARKLGIAATDAPGMRRVMEVKDIVQLVQKYPTTNESTHFACVMDPKQGSVVWCRRWMRPVTARWIREHMSETW